MKIPTAPGGNRSPEEYEIMKIDEKIDIFSTANVLYSILTGKRPWEHKLRREIRTNVMDGKKPPIDDIYRKPGTVDAALADIIDNAYIYDPTERWSADAIAQKLEYLLQNSSVRRRL